MSIKALVYSIYPAPYRVDVFKEMAKEMDLTVYFTGHVGDVGGQRDESWYSTNKEFSFELINAPNGEEKFKNSLKNISNYDIALVSEYTSKHGRMILDRCIRKRIPYFINVDGGFVNPGLLKAFIKKYYISRASGFFASGTMAEKYILAFGGKKEKIYYHHFSSVHKKQIFESPVSDEEKMALRKELGLNGNHIAVCVSRFVPYKRINILIDAWRNLPDDYEVVVIGGGPLKEEYEKQISDYGLKNVKIVDFCPSDKVFQYYKASDLYVHPADGEVWGLVVNEAMSVGLPVVTTTRCCAGVDLVDDGKNGYLVSPNDAEAISNAVKNLFKDEDTYKNMCLYSLKKIQPYTIEDNAKKHVEDVQIFLEKSSK